MNAQEFETAVRELRQLQRRFFNCKKDNPNREKLKELMRVKETLLNNTIAPIMALRPVGKLANNNREQFFLDVVLMLRRQKEWMRQGGGYWQMEPTKVAEKKVDEWLQQWNDEREAEKHRLWEEEQKRQLSLF